MRCFVFGSNNFVISSQELSGQDGSNNGPKACSDDLLVPFAHVLPSVKRLKNALRLVEKGDRFTYR